MKNKTKSTSKGEQKKAQCSECNREVPASSLTECIECGWGDDKACSSCVDDHMAEEHPEVE